MATLRCHHPPIISFHHCPRVHNVVRDAEKWRYMAFPSSFYWRSLLCSLLVLFHGHHREIRHDESAQTRGLKFPASNLFFGWGWWIWQTNGVTQARGKSFYCNAVISEGAYGKWTIKDLMLLTLLARAKISSVDFRSLFYTQSLGPLHFLLSAHRCTSFNRMCSQNDQPQRLKLCSCNYKQMGGFICT